MVSLAKSFGVVLSILRGDTFLLGSDVHVPASLHLSGPPLVCLGISGVANLMLIRALGATIRNPPGLLFFSVCSCSAL